MKYLYLALQIAGASGQSVFSKAYSAKSNINPSDSPHVFNMFYSLLIAVITLCLAGFSLHPTGFTWLFASVAGISATLYSIGVVNAATSGPYPFYTVTSIFGSLTAPIVVEFFVFHVRIAATGYTGIAVVVAAIILMTRTGEKTGKLSGRFLLSCLLIFVSNGIFGTMLLLQTKICKTAGGERTEYVFITYAVATVMSLLILLIKNRRRTLQVMKMGKLPALFTLGAAGAATLGRFMNLRCVSLFGATVSTPIGNCGVLLVVSAFSYLVFKEKQSKIQLLGDALAVAGIVLISL